MIIRERETMDVKVCSCGACPKFVQPDFLHTDIWLECPICGKKTKNTGGYHYAEEIPLEEAKRNAVIEWNKIMETDYQTAYLALKEQPNIIQVGYNLPKIKSRLKIGNMIISNTHHFNWFHRKMWKLFFGFEIENVEENENE